MKALRRVGLRGALVFLGPLLVYAPVDLVVRRRFVGAPPPIARLGLEALCLVLVAAATWLGGRSEALALPPRRAAQSLTGLAIGALWFAASAAPLYALGYLRVGDPDASASTALALVLAATAVNASMQELLFRGYPYSAAARARGTRFALLVSTALFVLLHAGAAAEAPWAFLNLALAGLLFGLLRATSGALWLPIGAHFAWNALVGPIAGLSVSGSHTLDAGARRLVLQGPALVSGGAFGIEASLATTVSTALAVVLVGLRAQRAEADGRLSP